jgi:hypothetical protein
MKTLAKFGMMLALSGTLFMTSCAGYYVYDQPGEPVYVRPAAPYAGAVWIGGEWSWVGGRYVYVHGYWAHPRPGRVYIAGGWYHGPRGYKWHRGYWR